MTPRIRLLERFGHRGAPDQPSAVKKSLAAAIEELLGTVAGTALAQPDLGMPDRSALVQLCPDENQQVRRLIEANLRRYEPRLGNVTVSCLHGGKEAGLEQRFLLDATLGAQRLRLVLTLDGHGRFRVGEPG